jgi:ubiquinone/menaquinone biosynthesis C-methylase UbiE
MNSVRDSDRDLIYALVRTPEEAERLSQQNALWREATAKVFDQLELSPGMSCLDFGCGAGDVMLALGRRVGPTGRVVGVDVDAELGRRVADELNKRQIADFSFVEADVTKPYTLPAEQFDVTSARFLLIHMKDPLALLHTMWGLTKPGGTLVVFDYDFRTHDTCPHRPELDEFIRVCNGVFDETGLDSRRGSKIPHFVERATGGPPDGIDVSLSITQGKDLREFLLASYRSLLPAALKIGVTTEDRAEDLIAFLTDPEAGDGHSYYWVWALYVSAWKRKP